MILTFLLVENDEDLLSYFTFRSSDPTNAGGQTDILAAK